MLNLELEELVDLIGGEGYVLRALGIHRTTLMRWRSGKTLPSQATMDVLRALAGKRLPGAGKDWEGWSFRRGKLIPPDFVWEFSAGDVAASYWNRARIKALEEEVRRLQKMVKELAIRAKPLDIAANDMAAWDADPRALDAPPAPSKAPKEIQPPPERELHPYVAFKRKRGYPACR